jgi:pyruvate ferredoxin oxidoreductase alpha subunit
VSQAVAVLGGSPYSYFRYELHLAMQNGLTVFDEVAKEFNEQFGRQYKTIESYRMDDAELAFVMMGSFSTKAKDAVDKLRDSGWAIGLCRPRMLRPFPVKQFQEVLSNINGIAVIDQNISMGMGGVLHTELLAAMYGQPDAPVISSFIGGLGGRDITTEEFFEMAKTTRSAVDKGQAPETRLLYSDNELREMRKLQSIAKVERDELGSNSPKSTGGNPDE